MNLPKIATLLTKHDENLKWLPFPYLHHKSRLQSLLLFSLADVVSGFQRTSARERSPH